MGHDVDVNVSTAPVRVFVADDDSMVVGSLEALISAQADMDFVGSCSSAGSLVDQFGDLCPDVAVLDANMPEMDLASIPALREQCPGVSIIVYSGDGEHTRELPDDERVRFVLKGRSPQLLLDAVRALSRAS
jgi:DNA-binding NarL/FixJ family response regulator